MKYLFLLVLKIARACAGAHWSAQKNLVCLRLVIVIEIKIEPISFRDFIVDFGKKTLDLSISQRREK